MSKFKIRRWSLRAGVRALKTTAQSAAAMIGTDQVGILELDWVQIGSVSAAAGVLSLLTSIGGLPELDQEAAGR